MDKHISLESAVERVKGLEALIGCCGVTAVTAALQETVTERWIAARDRLPYAELDDYLSKYGELPEFIVMIRGAVVPTTLTFDGECWRSARDGMTYAVTHWMPLPDVPEKEE